MRWSYARKPTERSSLPQIGPTVPRHTVCAARAKKTPRAEATLCPLSDWSDRHAVFIETYEIDLSWVTDGVCLRAST